MTLSFLAFGVQTNWVRLCLKSPTPFWTLLHSFRKSAYCSEIQSRNSTLLEQWSRTRPGFRAQSLSRARARPLWLMYRLHIGSRNCLFAVATMSATESSWLQGRLCAACQGSVLTTSWFEKSRYTQATKRSSLSSRRALSNDAESIRSGFMYATAARARLPLCLIEVCKTFHFSCCWCDCYFQSVHMRLRSLPCRHLRHS